MSAAISKKRPGTAAVFSAVFILMFICPASASKDIKRFRMIEFRDIYYLSKHEIIGRVDAKASKNEIIIDIDSLKRALDGNPLVNSYKISEDGNRLIVVVSENVPKFLCGFRRNGRLELFELDKKFRVISTGRIHAVNLPLVITSGDEIEKDTASPDLKKFLSMLALLSSGSLPGLVKAIEEIDLTDTQRALVKMEGRKTIFMVPPEKTGFFKLNDSVGYFDRIRFYPEVFEITDSLGIMKKRYQEN